MKISGRTTLSAFLDDFVVYRSLAAQDRRLPPFARVAPELGLPGDRVPRKCEPAYGAVVCHLLQRARTVGGSRARVEHLVYIGDTRQSDGTAFVNICRAGGWPGVAFLADEADRFRHDETTTQGDCIFYLTNRWSALWGLDAFCRERGFPIDDRTAVVVDLDKTAIGARGRNDHVIDQARLEAMHRALRGVLGGRYDKTALESTYHRLNRPEYHALTSDNQDLIVYLCLILATGLFDVGEIEEGVKTGHLSAFPRFLQQVEARVPELPIGVRLVHEEVAEAVRRSDPTPFTAFRHHEYLSTVERMGKIESGISVETVLKQRIVITQEVHDVAIDWRGRGALLFGLSDKPDAASIPTAELAARGYRPVHRTPAYLVGT